VLIGDLKICGSDELIELFVVQIQRIKLGIVMAVSPVLMHIVAKSAGTKFGPLRREGESTGMVES